MGNVAKKQFASIGHTFPALNAIHVIDAFYPQSRLDDQEQNLKCSHIWELDLRQVRIYSISQG